MAGRYRALALLCAAGGGLMALPARSEDQKPLNFDVGEAAKRLVPLKNAPLSGSVLTLQEHEKALFAGIAIDAIAVPKAAMTVMTGDITWTVPAESGFVLMTGFGGADSAGFGDKTSVWCELRKREPRKETKDNPAIALLKKSYEQMVTLCLLDTGNDGSWDKVIVTPAKRLDLRRSFDITPAGYNTSEGGMLPKSYVAVKFHHQNMFHTPRFYVEGALFGKLVQVQSLTFTNPDTTVMGSIETPPGEMPRELIFGEARFTIESIDSTTKTARVRIDKEWGSEPIKITRITYTY